MRKSIRSWNGKRAHRFIKSRFANFRVSQDFLVIEAREWRSRMSEFSPLTITVWTFAGFGAVDDLAENVVDRLDYAPFRDRSEANPPACPLRWSRRATLNLTPWRADGRHAQNIVGPNDPGVLMMNLLKQRRGLHRVE